MKYIKYISPNESKILQTDGRHRISRCIEEAIKTTNYDYFQILEGPNQAEATPITDILSIREAQEWLNLS